MAMEMQRMLPYPSPETQPFWDGCKRHELHAAVLRRKCDAFFFYPRQFCPTLLLAGTSSGARAAAAARCYTFAIQFRPQMPGFTPPYVTAIVQLDEGPRMMTNLVGVEPMPENIQLRHAGRGACGRTSPTRSRCRCSSQLGNRHRSCVAQGETA